MKFVRLDADDAFFSQCIDRISGKFNRLEQFKRNNWHRHIQFEIPRLAAKRNRRVAADNMSRDLDDRFTENRIDFARHDAWMKMGGKTTPLIGKFSTVR
jgi:hypothetical protein